MRRNIYIISVICCLLMVAGVSRAQDRRTLPEGYELVDSLVYVPAAQLDSSLVGTDVFREVKVHQSQNISDAFAGHLNRNRSRAIQGYRVRIFFDNSQSSRAASEAVLKSFLASHPGYAAYRSYVNPYFKVTVGDFRSRTDAMQLLNSIKGEYPSAFIVRESINFPVIDKEHSYVLDTVKVLRKVDYFQY